MIAAIGAPISNAATFRCAPTIFSAEPEAAKPAIKRSESPGKKRPIKRPVSAKMIARTPINPSVVTIECASNRLAMHKGYI
jgi:hypothetical protein